MAVDGAETQFVADQIGLTQVLVEISGTKRVTYTYGLARLAQLKDGSTEWFLGDALGSVRQLVDDSGDVVLVQSYMPFGQVLSTSGEGSGGYAFTGEQSSGLPAQFGQDRSHRTLEVGQIALNRFLDVKQSGSVVSHRGLASLSTR